MSLCSNSCLRTSLTQPPLELSKGEDLGMSHGSSGKWVGEFLLSIQAVSGFTGMEKASSGQFQEGSHSILVLMLPLGQPG